MPLTVAGGADWGASSRDFVKDPRVLCKSETLAGQSRAFRALSPVSIKAEESVIVLQKEAAIVNTHAKRRWLVSEEATTCCIVFLLSPSLEEGVLCAHVDDTSTAKELITTAKSVSNSWRMYMVGGYGESEDSVQTVGAVLRAAHSSSANFILHSFNVLGNNTASDGHPYLTAAAVDLASMTVHPAKVDGVPEEALLQRHLRLWASYDADRPLHWCYITVPSFRPPLPPGPLPRSSTPFRFFRPFSSSSGAAAQLQAASTPSPPLCEYLLPSYGQAGRVWAVDSVFCYFLLSLSDGELLTRTSTSPHCEGPQHVPRMRRMLQYILEDMHGLTDESSGGSSGSATGTSSGSIGMGTAANGSATLTIASMTSAGGGSMTEGSGSRASAHSTR